ncbi:zinc metalloprotease HtpX [Asticcacaulis machinosus]|uniref:Protease HtpX homolog n=1 Tax=Asticcacaulis machinosus TaxID=2984211 RepID=A0ABT5HKR1_9CAUL|nr:zinc metalloprotease HtpX [Asticcacaulis machinosus]MDC7676822.1 zinc metalloprotease HtpX [Asticcacaulis machinosus]
MNPLKTFMLLAGMTAVFGVIGLTLAGPTGMLIALGLALALNIFAYWNSDKMVLKAYRAEEVGPNASSSLVRNYYDDIVELAKRANLPMPKVYIIQNDQPNAFATGRNPENAAVAATTGLLQILDRDEIRGVMAHELAHVKNRDTLIMTVTATLAGAISSIANFAMFFGGGDDEDRPNIVVVLLMSILAPIAAMIVQMAISRSREYEADRVGAEICGDPESLARALKKIEAYARGIVNHQAEHNPASAHMFIINPLSGQRMDNLFSTHPNTDNRVKALFELAGRMGASRKPQAYTSVPTV